MERKGAQVFENLTPSEDNAQKPSAENFDAYLPWACNQLELYADVTVIKTRYNEYVNALTDRSKASKSRTKRKQASKTDLTSDEDVKDNAFNTQSSETNIIVNTIYDSLNNLVQIKLDNNRRIPYQLLQIIGLILQFQTQLTNITINRGLNNRSLYELNKLIKVSTITDVCLDNTVITNANYDILLDNPLRLLSLSRCKIDDEIVHKLSIKLTHPLATSNTLSILCLASNRITDVGAKYIAQMLRTNRRLEYLNLADNSITDEGSVPILDTLKEFYLTEEELILTKSRFIQFWYDKQKTIVPDQPVEDKKINRRKSMRLTTTLIDSPKRNRSEKDTSRKSTLAGPDFDDPFSSRNTTSKAGQMCCYGNNNLAYLNLSYNNLSYFTVKTLLSVLKTQRLLDRIPKGLVNVIIEGNCVPSNCLELFQIDQILESILLYHSRNYTQPKKRGQLKTAFN